MKRWNTLIGVATCIVLVSLVGNGVALVVGLDVRDMLRRNLERMDSQLTLSIKELPMSTTHCTSWYCPEKQQNEEVCTTCLPEWDREKCREEHLASVALAQKDCPPGEPPPEKEAR